MNKWTWLSGLQPPTRIWLYTADPQEVPVLSCSWGPTLKGCPQPPPDHRRDSPGLLKLLCVLASQVILLCSLLLVPVTFFAPHPFPGISPFLSTTTVFFHARGPPGAEWHHPIEGMTEGTQSGQVRQKAWGSRGECDRKKHACECNAYQEFIVKAQKSNCSLADF